MVVVVVLLVVVVAGALVVVALVVVVMVLLVCPQDPLAFRWGLVVGHSLQPLGLYSLVGSGGGSAVGPDGDRGRGVPPPWVGLASGAGGLRGPDDGALGDGNVDEGLDRVLLCDCLCGGGSRSGEGGSGCGGCGVLAWVWVMVWVRAGAASAAVVAFVIFGDVWGGFGDVVAGGGGGGRVAGGGVFWVPVLVLALVFGWGPLRGCGAPHSGGARAPMLGGGSSWCAAGVPGLPVWESGGLRQLGVRLQLWLWPWLCG